MEAGFSVKNNGKYRTVEGRELNIYFEATGTEYYEPQSYWEPEFYEVNDVEVTVVSAKDEDNNDVTSSLTDEDKEKIEEDIADDIIAGDYEMDYGDDGYDDCEDDYEDFD